MSLVLINRAYKKGFSLLEVLISIVVLAIGMLGIGKMILISQKSNASSYLKQQAQQSAYDIIDRMRLNRQAAIAGRYNLNNLTSGTPTIPATPSTNCETTTCNTTQLATYDTWYWLKTDLGQLPNGCGSITTSVSGIHTTVSVIVQWNESPTQTMLGVSAPTPAQLSFQTVL